MQPDALKEPQNETKIGQTEVADLNKIVRNKRGDVLEPTVPVQTVAQADIDGSVKPFLQDNQGGLTGPVCRTWSTYGCKTSRSCKRN